VESKLRGSKRKKKKKKRKVIGVSPQIPEEGI
jgi:hypothetical protein